MSEATVPGSAQRPRVPLRTLGDERLARHASEGDRHAFAAIYERHHQALYRYIRSIVHDPDDATDALQSAMLGALRGMAARDPSAPLKPWLFRIAHNEAINVLRRRRPQEDLDAVATRAGNDLERDAVARERLRQLVADLQELPERQRGALVMRELSGLDYEEIGTAFDVSPAAAKQTVYEARVALQARAEGRQMDCDAVRRSMSDGDRRMLRGRRIRAHLAACSGCSAFAEGLRTRPAQLAALAPPLGPTAAAGLLKGVLGGGMKGGGEGGAAAVVAGGGGKVIAGSLALKAMAVATVAATAGAVGATASGHLPRALGDMFGRESDNPARPAAVQPQQGQSAKRPSTQARSTSSERRKAAARRRSATEARAEARGHGGAGGGEAGHGGRGEGGQRGNLAGVGELPSAGGGRRAGGGLVGTPLRDAPVPKVRVPEVTGTPIPAPKVTPPALPQLPNPQVKLP